MIEHRQLSPGRQNNCISTKLAGLFDEAHLLTYFCPMFGPALTVSFWQHIINWDRSLFLSLNQNLVNPVFDAVLPFFRDSVFWAPLYLFLMAFVFLNFGRKGLWWAVGFVATIALADLLGTYAFKETVQRLRPCNEPLLQEQVRLVIRRCPGGYSFLSNHAANHFGLATFMVFTFRHLLKNWIALAYLWAALISFAQIYVGVHYPLDVVAGALLGFGAGYLSASVYRANFGTLAPLT
jgi:undecaprenyl-diphosphatase